VTTDVWWMWRSEARDGAYDSRRKTYQRKHTFFKGGDAGEENFLKKVFLPGFYEKVGFVEADGEGVFMVIPCKLF